MLNIFYIIDLVINLLILGGFLFRFKQTRVRYYAVIAAAVCAYIVADVLLAIIFDDAVLQIVLIYIAVILFMIGGLVLIMVMLDMMRSWVHSMRNAPLPAANKIQTSEKVVRALRIVYPSLTLLLVLFYVLLIFTLLIAGILAIIVGLAYTVCLCFQLGLVIWLWLDVRQVANQSQATKRNQLVRLGALIFFGAWPSLLSGVGAGIGTSICWWIWYGIALWPNALVGFDEEPVASLPSQQAYAAPMPGQQAYPPQQQYGYDYNKQ